MVRTVPTVLALLLLGCWVPPASTVRLDTHPEVIPMAEWTADELGAPDRCPSWSLIGVVLPESSEDFAALTGVSDEHTLAISFSYAPGWRGVIVYAPGPVFTYVVAHEVAHIVLSCMNGGIVDPILNHEHRHPIFDRARDYWLRDNTDRPLRLDDV